VAGGGVIVAQGGRDGAAACHAYLPRMSLLPDLPSPASPPKPKMTLEERRAREADRLASIRLRMASDRELEERGITDPHAIASALGMPVAEATKLLTRHQWREGDAALLETAAARLGVQVPKLGLQRL
jgi:hypothetical protein